MGERRESKRQKQRAREQKREREKKNVNTNRVDEDHSLSSGSACGKTDFGQSRSGHPDLTNLGQSNMGQSIFGHGGFGPANFGWILVVSGARSPQKMWQRRGRLTPSTDLPFPLSSHQQVELLEFWSKTSLPQLQVERMLLPTLAAVSFWHFRG